MGECTHPGYLIKDGNLVCTSCGEPSKKSKLVNGVIVPIPQKAKCPHCGNDIEIEVKAGEVKKVYKAQAEDKSITERETKIINKTENKGKK